MAVFSDVNELCYLGLKSRTNPVVAGQGLEGQARVSLPYLLVAAAGEAVLHRVRRVPALLRAESSLVRRVA